MGGKEHPQGPGWAAEGSLFFAEPLSQQSHQELVSPGYAKGWGNTLVPEPEKQEAGKLVLRRLGGPRPLRPSCAPGTCAEVHVPHGCTHPSGPCAAPCSSTASVTWLMHSTGLWKALLSSRSTAPRDCRRLALGAEAWLSNSQRNGAATESMTTRRAMPRDSRTGTFLFTHSSKASCGDRAMVYAGQQAPAPGDQTPFGMSLNCLTQNLPPHLGLTVLALQSPNSEPNSVFFSKSLQL